MAPHNARIHSFTAVISVRKDLLTSVAGGVADLFSARTGWYARCVEIATNGEGRELSACARMHVAHPLPMGHAMACGRVGWWHGQRANTSHGAQTSRACGPREREIMCPPSVPLVSPHAPSHAPLSDSKWVPHGHRRKQAVSHARAARRRDACAVNHACRRFLFGVP